MKLLKTRVRPRAYIRSTSTSVHHKIYGGATTENVASGNDRGAPSEMFRRAPNIELCCRGCRGQVSEEICGAHNRWVIVVVFANFSNENLEVRVSSSKSTSDYTSSSTSCITSMSGSSSTIQLRKIQTSNNNNIDFFRNGHDFWRKGTLDSYRGVKI